MGKLNRLIDPPIHIRQEYPNISRTMQAILWGGACQIAHFRRSAIQDKPGLQVNAKLKLCTQNEKQLLILNEYISRYFYLFIERFNSALAALFFEISGADIFHHTG